MPFPGGMSQQRRHRNPGLCDSAQCLSGMPHRFPGYLEIWRAGDAVRDFRMPVQMWIVAPAELTHHVSLSPKPTSTLRGKSPCGLRTGCLGGYHYHPGLALLWKFCAQFSAPACLKSCPFLRQDLKGCSPVDYVEKPTAPRWAWFEPLREGLILTPWVFCSPLRI